MRSEHLKGAFGALDGRAPCRLRTLSRARRVRLAPDLDLDLDLRRRAFAMARLRLRGVVLAAALVVLVAAASPALAQDGDPAGQGLFGSRRGRPPKKHGGDAHEGESCVLPGPSTPCVPGPVGDALCASAHPCFRATCERYKKVRSMLQLTRYKRFSPTARFQHLIVTYRIAFQLTGALFV